MLLDLLNWRYATKKMDPAKAVPQDKLDRIIDAIRLSPSSSGLQPYELLVVTNPGVREQLSQAAFGQQQLVDGSAVLVFAAWDNYTEERINDYFDYQESVRGFTNDGIAAYQKRLLDMYLPRSADENFVHTAKQAYIALGIASVAAADEGVDATPMEGFDAAKFDEILGLGARNLKTVCVMPLGYRDAENDWLAPLKKIRRPADQFVTTVA